MRAIHRPTVLHRLTVRPIALAWLVWAVGYLGRSLTLKRPEAGALAGLLLLLWLPALTASALFFNRALRASPGQRRPALALGIAFTLWTAAEILWSLSLLFPAAAIPATLADWLHLAGYPAAFAGLWLHPAPPREALQRLRFELDVAIYGGSWGLLLWAILIFPMLQQVVRDPHDLFWAATFPTLDLVLLLLIIWWQRQTPRSLPSLWFLAGGVFLWGIDKILPHLHIGFRTEEAEGIKTSWQRSVLLVLAITLHNIPEGLAVGVAFGAVTAGLPSADLAGAIALAIGIGIQNFPEGLAVSVPLRREGMSRLKSFWYGQLSAIVEPVAGVIGAAAVMLAQPLLPYALGFAAGAMIFVVVEEVIPESQRGGNTDLATMGAMAGFVVMMILDVGLG